MPKETLFQGVVTFFMTDVEGSTRLWEADSEAMGLAMREHDAIADEVIESYGGIVVKDRGEGDALFCVFDRATQAVEASVELLRRFQTHSWPTSVPLKVRIALHVGETELRSGDYYGPVVNRCARLRSIGYGQQIVLSDAVRLLVEGKLSQGLSLQDLGTHHLKDLSVPEQVFQVVAEGLPSEFPPLLSVGNAPHNLPQSLSAFVGRVRETEEVVARLQEARLLTLVGPGGTGKTRLSLHVAEELFSEFKDGIWLIELDQVTEPSQIPREIFQALRLNDRGGASEIDQIQAALERKKVLLILDNCEHLRDSVARLCTELLRKAKDLKILATSREPLGVSGESLYRVPSMALPLSQSVRFDELENFEAIQLFLQRAQLANQSFVLEESNAPAVVQICRQLDGIPFAIELAAARLRALSVTQLAERLTENFRVLGRGDTTRPSRQHTLSAMVEWSYGLLTDEEKKVLNRLSVFSGGCSLVAAESIVGFDPLEDFDVLGHLISLVDKSLVLLDPTRHRYRLLESIRQFSREKLIESGEDTETAVRHADYFQSQSAEIREQLQGQDFRIGCDRVDEDLDNFRRAMNTLEKENLEKFAVMMVDLFRFFDSQAMVREPYVALKRVLEKNNEDQFSQKTLGQVHQILGNLSRRMGGSAESQLHLERALDIFRKLNDTNGESATLINLATLFVHQGKTAEAQAFARPAVAACEKAGAHRSLATAHLLLGTIAAQNGDLQEAGDEFGAALKVSTDRGIFDLRLYALNNLGLNHIRTGEPLEALRVFVELLPAASSSGLKAIVLDGLRFCAKAARQLGENELSLKMYGIDITERQRLGINLGELDAQEFEQEILQASESMTEEHKDACIQHFAALTLDEALQRALGDIQAILDVR